MPPREDPALADRNRFVRSTEGVGSRQSRKRRGAVYENDLRRLIQEENVEHARDDDVDFDSFLKNDDLRDELGACPYAEHPRDEADDASDDDEDDNKNED